MNIILFGFFAVAIGVVYAAESDKKVVCYYQSWATYRQYNGKFDVSDITPEALSACTHLVYTFFGLQSSGDIKVLDPYLDLTSGRGNIAKFNALKKQNPHLKTLAAVGGWTQGSYTFSLVASDPAARSRFATNAVNFLSAHGFDGLSVDWIYPGQQGGNPAIDKANYVELLKVLHEQLNYTNLLLTASVAPLELTASYNVPEMIKYLDFINVLTYDYHGSWESQVGLNSPLYAGPADFSDIQKTLNVNASIVNWINEGAPANKIILSVALYGRTFTLADPLSRHLGAMSIAPGHAGPYTGQPGLLGYNEVCENLGRWSVQWENTQKTPFAYYANQWIGYDNERSVKVKAEYAIHHNLGGVMVYPIDLDDFKGSCGKRYPLLNALAEVLILEAAETTPPTSDWPETSDWPLHPSTTPSRHTPTTYPENVTEPHRPEQQCVEDGIFADLHDCAGFHLCQNGVKYSFKCPAGLLFDEFLSTCNYPDMVKCA